MKAFNPSEINKIKNSATQFFHRSQEAFRVDYQKFLEIDNYDQVEQQFDKVIVFSDYTMHDGQRVEAQAAGVVVYFSMDKKNDVQVYSVHSLKRNMTFTVLDNSMTSVMKGKNGKNIETLHLIPQLGMIYDQPQNRLPGVLMTLQGGFKSLT